MDLQDPFYGNGYSPAEPVSAMDVHKFIAAVLRYWRVPVLSVGAALAGVVVYILATPPTYVSGAKMWETEKMRLPGETITDDMQDYITTQIQLLKSDKIKELALQRLLDQRTPIPRVKQGRLGTLLAHLTGQETDDGGLGRPIPVRLKVNQAPKTTVITFSAFSKNRAYTQAYLKAYMETFLEYKKNVRKVQSGETFTSISAQAISMGDQLKADQNALMDFEQSNNLAVLEEENSIAGEYLTRLQTQLSGFELQSQVFNSTAGETDGAGEGKNLTGGFRIDSTPDGKTLAGARTTPPPPLAGSRQSTWTELAALKIQRQALSKNLRPEHPNMVKLDLEIEQGEKLLDDYRNSVRDSIQQWNAKVVDANNRIAQAQRLKLNVERTQTLYDRLVTLLQSVDISREVDREFLAVFEPASPAVRSFRTDLMLLSLAVFGGLCGGLGIVLLIQVRDDRITSFKEVEELFGGSIVGMVPETLKLDRDGTGGLLKNAKQRDVYAESFRNLRSALLFLPADRIRPKIILITSALPSEGKSTISINLAKALAFGGSRVLLVDGDLRKGQIHKVFGLASQPGFADLVQAPELAEKIIHENVLPNLSFVARGATEGHPGDLCLRPEIEQVFSRWRQQFDYVLVDSCPLFAADDAATLANKVDGTLFVVRRGFSRNRVVREALELLLQRQASVLGLIYNCADSREHPHRFYQYTDYHRAVDHPVLNGK
jgi:capsular exopolysaccharide synthesis family protein